jgi:N-methylhydantoinase B/oxoprolinase/acetone carboxylase alpha subunit
MANTRNVPCEEIELRYPLRIERYELRPEAPGAGRLRGGVGHVRDVRFLVDGFFSCNGDRTLEAPIGIFGGGEGLGARLIFNPGSANETEWPSKISGRRVSAGNVIRVMGPSSGGYGDPFERDAELVLTDCLNDVVSVEEARDSYGVVVHAAERRIDEVATRKARSVRRGQ